MSEPRRLDAEVAGAVDASARPRELPESVARNIVAWTRHDREHTDEAAESNWLAEHITWGIFGVPDEAVGSPLADVDGLDVVELGCGTAYVSAWLARRGARPIRVPAVSCLAASASRQAASATGHQRSMTCASPYQGPPNVPCRTSSKER